MVKHYWPEFSIEQPVLGRNNFLYKHWTGLASLKIKADAEMPYRKKKNHPEMKTHFLLYFHTSGKLGQVRQRNISGA